MQVSIQLISYRQYFRLVFINSTNAQCFQATNVAKGAVLRVKETIRENAACNGIERSAGVCGETEEKGVTF